MLNIRRNVHVAIRNIRRLSTQSSFDPVADKAINIIINITERMMHKMLHLYCEPTLLQRVSNATYLDVSGVSDEAEEAAKCQTMEEYRSVTEAELAPSIPLSFDASSFQLVTALHPLNREAPGTSVSELVRVLSDDGYGIIGAPESVWIRDLIFDQIQTEDDAKRANIYSLQKVDLGAGNDKYFLALIRV